MRSLARLGAALCLAFVAVQAPSSAQPGLDVVAENAQPGTLHWAIKPAAFTQATLAFADRASVMPGDTFGLYVSCEAPTFIVDAFRIGDYDGLGARRVWQSRATACVQQPRAAVNRTTGMAHAPWKRSLDINTTNWPIGAYVLALRAADHSATYVDLIVRSSNANGRVVFVSSTQTSQAYNSWGGASLYRGSGGFRTRARVVSYDRPQTRGLGSGKFLAYEAPVIRRAEALGLPLAYVADVDLAVDPSLLDGAVSVVFGGHAEYWTQAQRDAVLRARSRGSNLLFFGANTAFWRARLMASALGAQRQMAVYKSRSEDPDTAEPSIRFRDLGQSDAEVTGVLYSCYPVAGDLVVANATSWVFAGTGVHEGDRVAQLIGPEVDKLMHRRAGMTVLANSKVSCGHTTTHSTMLLMRDPSGASTFATGTMGWVPKGLTGALPAATSRFVRTVTDNVLRASTSRGLAPAQA